MPIAERRRLTISPKLLAMSPSVTEVTYAVQKLYLHHGIRNVIGAKVGSTQPQPATGWSWSARRGATAEPLA